MHTSDSSAWHNPAVVKDPAGAPSYIKLKFFSLTFRAFQTMFRPPALCTSNFFKLKFQTAGAFFMFHPLSTILPVILL